MISASRTVRATSSNTSLPPATISQADSHAAAQGRLLEEGPQRQFERRAGAQAGDQPSGQQGMPPEVEEIVFKPDARDAEELRPDFGHDLFRLGLRPPGRHKAASRARRAASGAGSARRSTLPLGVSGSADNSMKAEGTM